MMKYLKILAVLACLPVAAFADINIDGVGGISNWYFHADFEKMRSTEAGRPLYDWMKGEVFDEVKDESGVDVDKDLHRLTAQSDGADGVIVLLDGTLRQEHKDQIMALAATQNVELKPRKAGRREYFFVEGELEDDQDNPFRDGAYFSFDLNDKLLLTSSEARMQELLGNGGKMTRRNKQAAMIVFSAEKTFVEAGIETDPASGAEWDSNIMKNTEEAAFIVADAGGKIGVEAQLVSKEPEMAESLASIVRGLISLQVFNEDLEPGLADMLKQTKVSVKDKTLSISISLDPQLVVDTLNQ